MQPPPPQENTFRRTVWDLTAGLQYFRAYWGRRLVGGAIGLFGDILGEGSNQAFYARLPGHEQQAEDSLRQVGFDRGLNRFRGETIENWTARVRAAWDDYDQGGTPQQMLRVVNQWGFAGWPDTWDEGLVTLDEDIGIAGRPFSFRLTIGFGIIDPPWGPEVYGSGILYGETGLYYGIGQSTDIEMLLHIVRKWKPARSRAYVRIYWSETDFTEFER